MAKIESKLSALLVECKSAERITDAGDIRKILARDERADAVTESAEGAPVVRRPIVSAPIEFASAPAPDRLKQLVEARGMPWDPAYAERAVPYWASDERVDHHGDIVRQSWKFGIFEGNSPMPFDHDWGGLPVGRVVDWSVGARSVKDYSGPALSLLGIFATPDTSEWADSVFRLVKAGFLPAGSVGFIPGTVIQVQDEKERQKLGLGKWGVVLDDNSLLEFSPTLIPANSGALALLSKAAHAKSIQPYDVHVLRELDRRQIRGKSNEREEWIRIENTTLQIARLLWQDEPWELHRELDVPVTLAQRPRSEAAASATDTTTAINERLERAIAQIDTFTAQGDVVLNDIRERVEELSGLAPAGATDAHDDGHGHEDRMSPQLARRLEKALAGLGD